MESSTTVASLHFINGVNTQQTHSYTLTRARLDCVCVSECFCMHEFCASLSLHSKCTLYNFYNMLSIPPFMLCTVLTIFTAPFLSRPRLRACVPIVLCDFLFENDLLLSCVCLCVLYTSYVLPCRFVHFKNIVHSMCAMDFLTNDINIYITCPHSSLFLFSFLLFPIFRSTFYYIVSRIRASLRLSLALSPLVFSELFCHLYFQEHHSFKRSFDLSYFLFLNC